LFHLTRELPICHPVIRFPPHQEQTSCCLEESSCRFQGLVNLESRAVPSARGSFWADCTIAIDMRHDVWNKPLARAQPIQHRLPHAFTYESNLNARPVRAEPTGNGGSADNLQTSLDHKNASSIVCPHHQSIMNNPPPLKKSVTFRCQPFMSMYLSFFSLPSATLMSAFDIESGGRESHRVKYEARVDEYVACLRIWSNSMVSNACMNRLTTIAIANSVILSLALSLVKARPVIPTRRVNVHPISRFLCSSRLARSLAAASCVRSTVARAD
jgi:hypothetical protein